MTDLKTRPHLRDRLAKGAQKTVWIATSASGAVAVLGELPSWTLDQIDDWMANFQR